MDQRAQAFRRPDSVGKTFLRTFLPSLVLLLVALPAPSLAQVTAITPTTGTGNLGTTVTPSGNLYNITGGTRPGNGPNLFHSFGLFSVGTSDIANFSNDTGLSTTNILSRVTGGNPSNIFGTIQTTGFGSANLFLINPAGVLFGPTASLNVGGSFHVSTADYVRMFDGTSNGYFYADPARPSVLTSAPVAAFGFLSPNPAAIAIQGSNLSVPTGQTLSVVGGEITIQGGTLSAPSGRIQIASVGAPTGDSGEVIIRSPDGTPNFQLAGFASSGQIQIVKDPAPVLDGGNILTVGSVTNLDGTFHITLLDIGENGRLNAVTPLPGPDYLILAEQGKLREGDLQSNLFFTFSRFDLLN